MVKEADKELAVLENQYLRVTFDPAQGGQCVGLVTKNGKVAEDDFVLHIFDDMDWSRHPHHYQPFSFVEYNCEIAKDTPKEAVLHLWKRGKEEFHFCIVHKHVHLYRDRGSVRVDYEIENIPEAMGSREFRLNCHNGLHPSRQGTFYLPTTRGVRRIPFGRSGMHQWSKDPPRAWSGVINDRLAGIGCAMQFGHLFLLYDWLGKDVANMEWRYLPVVIDAGKNFQTTVWVVPFWGLEQVDHLASEAVFEIRAPDELEPGADLAGKLRVFSAENREVSINIEVRAATGKEWRPVKGGKDFAATAGAIAELPFAIEGTVNEPQVIRFRVRTGDRTVASFEKFIGLKGVEAEYVYQPVEGKLIRPPEKRGLRYQPSMDYVTPHSRWYRPYAGGKVKALFLMSFANIRHVVEYAQRLPIDYTVPTLSQKRFFPNDGSLQMSVDDYIRQLDEYVTPERKYDVIVIGPLGRRYYHGTDFTKKFWSLPKSTHGRIVQKVRDGTGLLVLANVPAIADPKVKTVYDIYEQLKGGGEEDEFLGELEDEDTPELNVAAPGFDKEKVVHGLYGKGRVVFLRGGAGAYPAILECLLWCAGKEPEVSVARFSTEKPELEQETMTRSELVLKLNAPRAIEDVVVELSLKTNGAGQTEAEKTLPTSLKKGENSFTWAIPHLPAGPHLAVFRALEKEPGNVLKSGSFALRVKPCVSVEEVKVLKETVKPGETNQGTVRLKSAGKLDHEVECLIELMDTFGRVTAAVRRPAQLAAGEERELSFELQVKNPLAVIQDVRARVFEKGKLLSEGQGTFTVPSVNTGLDDWISWAWPGMGPSDQLHRLGFNTYQGDYVFNLRSARLPVSFGKWYRRGIMGVIRCDWQSGSRLIRQRPKEPGCLTNPEILKAADEKHAKAARIGHRFGALGYNVQDEPSLTHWESNAELCWSDTCMAHFREWAKKTYGTIEALNQEWETDFKSWDAVEPMVEAEVKDRPNIAPWLDYRESMHLVWTKFFKRTRDTVLGIDPGKYFGFCGVAGGHPYSGFDFWRLGRFCDFVQPYAPCAILRSFNDQGYYRRWTGYYRSYLAQWDEQWGAFFDGQRGLNIWTSAFLILPDYTFSPHFAPAVQEINHTFSRGIQRLFMETERVGEKDVLFHYSQASIDTNYMMKYWQKEIPNQGSRGVKYFRKARAGLMQLFHDAGRDLNFISYEQVARGDLVERMPVVFVLPISTAVSPKEAGQIREYVRKGGIVIADVCPALRDEHGKPAPGGGQLDDLFGIRRNGEPRDTLLTERGAVEGLLGELELPVEHGIEARGGKALFTLKGENGSFPLAITNTFGKGRTLYLAFVSQYGKGRAASQSLLGLFQSALEEVNGPQPLAKLTNRDGDPVACWRLLHRGERGHYFGFYRDLSYHMDPLTAKEEDVKAEAFDARAHLGEERHVYDLLEQEYLGHRDDLPLRIVPGRGRLFASYPYKVEKLQLEVALGSRKGEELKFVAKLSVSEGPPDLHVAHLAVRTPEGKEARYYARNVVIRDGRFEGRLPLALNMMPGDWTIELTETASGLSSKSEFSIAE